MVCRIVIYKGTGKARCPKCGKIIPKGERGLEAWGYHTSCRYCFNCCMNMLTEAEEGLDVNRDVGG